MSNWFHTVLGRYNISDKWIGLDYGQLFLDPVKANLTLAHEMTHGVLAMVTDFGQTTNVISKVIDDFTHLDKTQKEEVVVILAHSQLFVQEGFATFMEISQLGKITNRNNALTWAQKNLPPDYLGRFNKLMFAFDMQQRYRDFFTGKISQLAMETGLRKFLYEQNLLKDPDKLKKYLADENNNPDARLNKMLKTLRYKEWIVTKSIPEIAKACDITYFEPATKEEVAQFLTYVTSYTKTPKIFTANEIGDTPQGKDAFMQAGENMIIANMNLNLAKTATPLFNLEDFLFYADKMEIMFISPQDENWEHRALVKSISGTEPEIGIAGFFKTGEKYISVTSKEKMIEILANQLKHITLMVKWGGYDLIKKQQIWSEMARLPDVVVYNTTQEMLQSFEMLLNATPATKFVHLHAGAAEGHPLQTLIVVEVGRTPVHIVNTYGNKGIAEILQLLKNQSQIMSETELRSRKRHLNNIMSLWMNLHWDVDWIESMIDKKTLIFRK